MTLDFAPIWAHRDQIAEGLLTTIALSAAALAGALAIGTPIGIAGATGGRPGRLIATAYVEAVRNVPLLLHIHAWYLGLAWLDLPPFLCAALGLSIYSAAYAAEIIRAGLRAIPAGQTDAARALGLGRWATFRRVLAPQAARIIAPSMANLFSQLVKDSSLASVIAVGELAYQAGAIEADTFRSLEVYLTTTVLYVALVTLLTRIVRPAPRALLADA